MGRRRNSSARPAALWLVLGLAACGGNVAVPRGFQSRQVLPLRDANIKFSYVTDVAGADPVLVYSTLPEGATAPTQWSLNLVTGEQQAVGVDPPPAGMVSPGTAHYTCGVDDFLPDGTKTLEITDTTTGLKTDIDGVTSFGRCVRDDGTFAVFRLDPATGDQVLWAGPYQQMAPVALPFDVLRVVFYRTDPVGQLSTVIVLGSAPAQPDAAGIYAIDLTSNGVTEVVPPTPASATWAAGAPQAGSLQSTSVTADLDVTVFHGHYIYARKMSDGGTTLFAGPFSSGSASELALFQLAPSGTAALGTSVFVYPSDDASGHPVAPHITGWQVDSVNGAPSQLVVWDDDSGQVTLCPSSDGAFEFGLASADGAHALFSALQLGGQLTAAPLQLLALTPGQPHTCTVLQGGNVLWADFSGDGSKIAWISKTEVGLNSDLWTADSDGGNAQMVLSGPLFAAAFVRGTTHLELSYDGDLVWLDVRDPSHFSYVAEQLFGDARGVGGSWFVAGYNYSAQDASGLLGVVSLDTGQKLPISAAVSQFLAVAQTAPDDTAAATEQTRTGVTHVVYLVRGRNPSSQDGIWVATVNAADLQ